MQIKDLIHIGIRRIQKLGRIAIQKDELDAHSLKEGELVDVYLKKKGE